MRARTSGVRSMTVLLAVVLLAGACSDDSNSSASTAADMAASDGPATPEMESKDMESGDPTSSGPVDCAAIQDAFESVGSAGDPSAGDGSDLQQDLENTRAAMLTLKSQAPEIADDLDVTVRGLDAMIAVYEEVGWDTDPADDPLAFVQAVARSEDILGMYTGLTSLLTWLETNCS